MLLSIFPLKIPDEGVYGIWLTCSILLGPFISTIPPRVQRKTFGGILGFGGAFLFCGIDVLHSLTLIVVAFFIHKSKLPNRNHALIIWSFSYLLFFRCCHMLGLPKPCNVSNAIQLVGTLKAAGLSYKDKEEEKEEVYSFHDVFMYFYCYLGLITGPFYSLPVWRNSMLVKNLDNGLSNIEFKMILPKVGSAPFWALGYTILSKNFPAAFTLTSDFDEFNIFYKFLYIAGVFSWFRCRFYLGWRLAEVGLITSRFGIFPTSLDPKPGFGITKSQELSYHEINKAWLRLQHIKRSKAAVVEEVDTKELNNWTCHAIENIDIWGVEFSSTTAEKLRLWNRTVQTWMNLCIYRQIPRSWPYVVKVAITMFTSAFWHGIHPGYYMSLFFTVPLCLWADNIWSKILPVKVFSIIGIFFSMRWFEYECLPFVLLTYEDTMTAWKACYFHVHCISIILIFTGLLIQKLLIPRKMKQS